MKTHPLQPKGPDDPLGIPLFLLVSSKEYWLNGFKGTRTTPRYQVGHARRDQLVCNAPPTLDHMRKTEQHRGLRAAAVRGAVDRRHGSTFQGLCDALAHMDENEIRSGLRRAIELRWVEQDGRRYYSLDNRRQRMVSDEHASPPGDAEPTAPETPPAAESPAPQPQEADVAVKAKKASKKSSKGAKKAVKAAAPKKAAKAAKPKKEAAPVDAFGLRVGSKRAIAAAMFVKGCTMGDVKKNPKVGQTVYNLLTALAADGHKVKNEDGVITLKAK